MEIHNYLKIVYMKVVAGMQCLLKNFRNGELEIAIKSKSSQPTPSVTHQMNVLIN